MVDYTFRSSSDSKLFITTETLPNGSHEEELQFAENSFLSEDFEDVAGLKADFVQFDDEEGGMIIKKFSLEETNKYKFKLTPQSDSALYSYVLYFREDGELHQIRSGGQNADDIMEMEAGDYELWITPCFPSEKGNCKFDYSCNVIADTKITTLKELRDAFAENTSVFVNKKVELDALNDLIAIPGCSNFSTEIKNVAVSTSFENSKYTFKFSADAKLKFFETTITAKISGNDSGLYMYTTVGGELVDPKFAIVGSLELENFTFKGFGLQNLSISLNTLKDSCDIKCKVQLGSKGSSVGGSLSWLNGKWDSFSVEYNSENGVPIFGGLYLTYISMSAKNLSSSDDNLRITGGFAVRFGSKITIKKSETSVLKFAAGTYTLFNGKLDGYWQANGQFGGSGELKFLCKDSSALISISTNFDYVKDSVITVNGTLKCFGFTLDGSVCFSQNNISVTAHTNWDKKILGIHFKGEIKVSAKFNSEDQNNSGSIMFYQDMKLTVKSDDESASAKAEIGGKGLIYNFSTGEWKKIGMKEMKEYEKDLMPTTSGLDNILLMKTWVLEEYENKFIISLACDKTFDGSEWQLICSDGTSYDQESLKDSVGIRQLDSSEDRIVLEVDATGLEKIWQLKVFGDSAITGETAVRAIIQEDAEISLTVSNKDTDSFIFNYSAWSDQQDLTTEIYIVDVSDPDSVGVCIGTLDEARSGSWEWQISDDFIAGDYYFYLQSYSTEMLPLQSKKTDVYTIEKRFADIAVSDLGIKKSYQNTGGLSVVFNVDNLGTVDADAFTIKVYLSEDQDINTSDELLILNGVTSLAGYDSLRKNLSVSLPADLPQGTYYIGIVVDSEDVLDEKFWEDNNVVSRQFTVDAYGNVLDGAYSGEDILLDNVMPQAEYMYGCTVTALGMIIGYYDLYGYADGTDLSNLIEGDVAVKSRGTDGDIYNMNAFDTVLGNFIASEEYIYRFYSRDNIDDIVESGPAGNYTETTPAQELQYSFVNGGTNLNTGVWNSLADYIGTGQYWRGQGNLSTSMAYDTLENIANSTSTRTISGDGYSRTIDYKYTTLLYGLDLYAQSRGYSLDYEITGTYLTDNNGGDFTFEDYMAEIDAGRAVLISIEDHSMVGYGYNAQTREIIFDDDYRSDQRMVWGKNYFYSGKNRKMQSITVIGFNTADYNVDLSLKSCASCDEPVILSSQLSASTSNEYFFDGDILYTSFAVCNEGEDACGAFSISIYLDGNKVETLTVDKLATQETIEFKDIALEAVEYGNHTVEVRVDDTNLIQEPTASNNNIEQHFQVLRQGTEVISGSRMIASGETLSDAFVTAGGSAYVSGGCIDNLTLMGEMVGSCSDGGYWYNGASVYASAGGVIKNAEIQEYGYVHLRNGGSLSSATINHRGFLKVLSGGFAVNTQILSGGVVNQSAGIMSYTEIKNGGRMVVTGGTASRIEIDGNISAYYSGAMLSGVNMNRNGYAYIFSGATMQEAKIKGFVYASSDAKLNDIEITSGGSATVTSRAVIQSATVNNGWLNVSSMGIVSSAVLNKNGSMSLRNGAVSSDTFVGNGGAVYCFPSGCLKGKLTIAGGIVQNALTNITAGVSEYEFILQQKNDIASLSYDEGGISANANITIDVTNAWGEYILIDGALDKIGSASFTVVNGNQSVSAEKDQTLTLNNGKTVKLSTKDSHLIASISGTDNVAPEKPSDIKTSLEGNKLEISWTAQTDFSGASYEVEYSKNKDFSDSKNLKAMDNHIQLSLPSGIWYWRLRTVDGAGNKSAWTAVQKENIDYSMLIAVSSDSTIAADSDIILQRGVSITASITAALQLLDDDYTIELNGNNTLSCSSIRNAAILFGDDAYWVDTYGYGAHHDGTVNFNGENISLYSDVSSCITAAGIIGNNLTVSFHDVASGADSITIEATNPSGRAGNIAAGIMADGDLKINGNFGGIINCHFDFSDVALESRRSGSLYGLSAGNDLSVNGNISGNIFTSGVSTSASYAYGLHADGNLSVSGKISGIISATAEKYSYAILGKSVNITVTGTIYAAESSANHSMDVLLNKLEHFETYKNDLLDLTGNQFYAVRVSGSSNISFEDDALCIGKIQLNSNNVVITISDAARVYGDLSTSYYGNTVVLQLNNKSLKDSRITTSNWNSAITLKVNADEVISNGTYTLIDTGSISSAQTVTISLGTQTHTLKSGESATLNGVDFQLVQENSGTRTKLNLVITNCHGSVKVTNLQGSSDRLNWEAIPGAEEYIAEYSIDNFATSIKLTIKTNEADIFGLPTGTYQWRVGIPDGKPAGGKDIISGNTAPTSRKLVSDADGNMDVFFGTVCGKWETDYWARHQGTQNGWRGTEEKVVLGGKNQFSDIFRGSTDANVLLLTDDANGDALFVDDVYTGSFEDIAKSQSRLAHLDEIRAGAGNDVIDMTSQAFDYIGDGLTIYGGDGDDVIWSNNGDNKLYGDYGNDKIVGGEDNDLIVGGAGNDIMHGGGGDDIFTFGENFGHDYVKQLEDGSVTLWFETGSEENWDVYSMTYTDGINSVTVSGTTDVILKFGNDAAELPNGAFVDSATDKIFEDNTSGMLA